MGQDVPFSFSLFFKLSFWGNSALYCGPCGSPHIWRSDLRVLAEHLQQGEHLLYQSGQPGRHGPRAGKLRVTSLSIVGASCLWTLHHIALQVLTGILCLVPLLSVLFPSGISSRAHGPLFAPEEAEVYCAQCYCRSCWPPKPRLPACFLPC